MRATLDSVLAQTLRPDEILVMDDGSTDETSAILDSYGDAIIVFRQKNGGLSSARNFLCARANGSLLAFLDSDDLWHPRYLEVQFELFCKYPHAALFFIGHENFYEDDAHSWPSSLPDCPSDEIPALTFLQRYNQETGPFSSYSFCCVPREVLARIGGTPFQADGAEDFYCTALLCLLGPAIYCATPLAAYRVRSGSLSSKRVAGLAARVRAFELLEGHYTEFASPEFLEAFKSLFSSHRRVYAKYLMGVRNTADARRQLGRSMTHSKRAISLAKSIGLLCSTYLPTQLQPAWPTRYQR